MAIVICRPRMSCVIVATALPCSVTVADDGAVGETMNLRLTLRDTGTGQLVPGRITVKQQPVGAKSAYHFVKSLHPQGTAVPYDVTRSETSFEKHTTVSAHPFATTVPPGYYVVYYEHGPEWRGNKAQVHVKASEVAALELPTSRWIDMNARGWYSGDTHVHRSVEDSVRHSHWHGGRLACHLVDNSRRCGCGDRWNCPVGFPDRDCRAAAAGDATSQAARS